MLIMEQLKIRSQIHPIPTLSSQVLLGYFCLFHTFAFMPSPPQLIVTVGGQRLAGVPQGRTMTQSLGKGAPNALSLENILQLLPSVEHELSSWCISSYTKMPHQLNVEDLMTSRSDGGYYTLQLMPYSNTPIHTMAYRSTNKL